MPGADEVVEGHGDQPQPEDEGRQHGVGDRAGDAETFNDENNDHCKREDEDPQSSAGDPAVDIAIAAKKEISSDQPHRPGSDGQPLNAAQLQPPAAEVDHAVATFDMVTAHQGGGNSITRDKLDHRQPALVVHFDAMDMDGDDAVNREEFVAYTKSLSDQAARSLLDRVRRQTSRLLAEEKQKTHGTVQFLPFDLKQFD